MNSPIYCLMIRKVSLTRQMSDRLFDEARQMIIERSRAKSFKSQGLEEVITTSFEQKVIGCFCGVEFSADVVTSNGPGKVNFLVSNDRIEDRSSLRWGSIPLSGPEEVLQKIVDRRRNAVLN